MHISFTPEQEELRRELREYFARLMTPDLREALEQCLAMQKLPPGSRPREELQQRLSEVIAEQDDRARIRRAGTHA